MFENIFLMLHIYIRTLVGWFLKGRGTWGKLTVYVYICSLSQIEQSPIYSYVFTARIRKRRVSNVGTNAHSRLSFLFTWAAFMPA